MVVKAMAPDWAESAIRSHQQYALLPEQSPGMADSIAVGFLSVVRTIPYATAFFQPLLQTRS